MKPLLLVITWHGAWCFVLFARRLPPNRSKRTPRQPLQCVRRWRLHAAECYTLQTQASNGWFTQDKIQSNKIELSIWTNACSTMAPYLAKRTTNDNKKSQSYVGNGVHYMCLQLGIVERLAPTLIDAERMHFECTPTKIVQGVNL